jgi:hypothetical protein
VRCDNLHTVCHLGGRNRSLPLALVRACEVGEAFIRSVGNEPRTKTLPSEAWDRLGALRQTQGLAVLAAFFCLLFFAAVYRLETSLTHVQGHR